jgi:undecaprenyl-diphosphatase
MTWWQALVLGVVQGLTEFLPVSSSGHLVVAEAAVGLSTPGVLVEVVLHVGTLLAVVIVYWRTLWRLLHGAVVGDRGAWRYILLLFLATIPAAVAGFSLEDLFKGAFDSLLLVGINFVVTGMILWSTRGRVQATPSDLPSAPRAVAIGVAQALAILPGISRSGTTVSLGLWLGLDPVRAAEFSFLMAIPTIAGAAVLQAPELTAGISSVGGSQLAFSFVAALVSGVLAIRLLIALLQRKAFYRFAPYCWAIGLATILWAVLG